MNASLQKNISPQWLKAALLGSMWASGEVVMGSFLHNIHFPFTGVLLSAFGMCILTAGSFLWKEYGIIWKSGVVCACMKSISPSAVILGPMLGIIIEACILEISIFIFRKNFVGYIIGCIIATSIPLIQKIISLLITFGFEIATLLKKMFLFVEQTLHIQLPHPYYSLLILFILPIILGSIAAFFGKNIAKNLHSSIIIEKSTETHTETLFTNPSQSFSLIILFAHFFLLPLGIFLIANSSLWITISFVFLYSIIIHTRYKNIWKRIFLTPSFIIFTVIILLAGFIVDTFSYHGFFMLLRAVFVITAFSVIGKELRNPKIINFFFRKNFSTLPATLEISFAALPTMISALKFRDNEKKFLLKPFVIINTLFASGIEWLKNYNSFILRKSPIFILTGEKQSGKTTLVLKIIEELQQKNISVGGIIAKGVHENGERIGFDIIDIQTNEQKILCRKNISLYEQKIGEFYFTKDGLEFGKKILGKKSLRNLSLIIIDEVGPLELQGNGWAESLSEIIFSIDIPVLLVVRKSLVNNVCNNWLITPKYIWKENELVKNIVDDIVRSI